MKFQSCPWKHPKDRTESWLLRAGIVMLRTLADVSYGQQAAFWDNSPLALQQPRTDSTRDDTSTSRIGILFTCIWFALTSSALRFVMMMTMMLMMLLMMVKRCLWMGNVAIHVVRLTGDASCTKMLVSVFFSCCVNNESDVILLPSDASKRMTHFQEINKRTLLILFSTSFYSMMNA